MRLVYDVVDIYINRRVDNVNSYSLFVNPQLSTVFHPINL